MTEAIILSCRRDFLIGVNNTNTIFHAYTPVGIGDAGRAALAAETLLRVPINIASISPVYPAWGVCREEIRPGKCGEVQIIGITPCRIRGQERKPYADITDDGLCYADSGWGIISPADGDENALPLLLLGSSRVENYSGYFSVVRTPGGAYRCIDGAHPDSDIAGRSDLGNLAAGSISPDGGVFWLYATYTQGGGYALTLTRPSGNSYGKHQLAHLAGNGRIVQDHTTGYIHWNAFYAV